MGFNNGYDSGYSDCEAENRKRWEREAVERYKAENPPSGGGSHGTAPVQSPVETVQLSGEGSVDGDENEVSFVCPADVSDLKVGETRFIDCSNWWTDYVSKQSVSTELTSFTGRLRLLLPADVTTCYDTMGMGISADRPTAKTIDSHFVYEDISAWRDPTAIIAATRASTTTCYLWPVQLNNT